jgi:protein TonB
MTLALLSPGQPDRVVSVHRRPEDRWSAPNQIGRFSLGMAAVVLASLAIHAIVVATALVSGHAVSTPPQEIAVEIVHEVPRQVPDKPAPDALAKLDFKAATAPKADPPKAEAPRAEPPKVDAPKPEPSKDEAKAEDKPAPAKPEPPKQQAATAESPKAEPAKAEPPKPQASPAADEALKALQSQLDALKAEHEALETERVAQAQEAAAAQAEAAASRGPIESGLGPLPDSFRAVALPAMGEAGDEAVSYQQIVFSQLAKAKAIGQWKGAPGTAGVHFSIDETGKLLDVEIVHKSGVSELDAEALAIVRRAAPFPTPPRDGQRSFDAMVNAGGEPAP